MSTDFYFPVYDGHRHDADDDGSDHTLSTSHNIVLWNFEIGSLGPYGARSRCAYCGVEWRADRFHPGACAECGGPRGV